MSASQISYSYDWSDSKKFLAKSFIVIDSILELYFVKPAYGWASGSNKFRNSSTTNFARSRFGQSEILFTEWLGWYQNFCLQ